MSYRPYPDADRALAQLERGRVPEPARVLTVQVDTSALEDALRRFGEAARAALRTMADHLAEQDRP